METSFFETQTLSRHAAVRMAQRSIPEAAIELVLAFGTRARVKGADSYFFDKASRQHMSAKLGDETARRIERYLNAYTIVGDDGCVITAGWRTRRLRRA